MLNALRLGAWLVALVLAGCATAPPTPPEAVAPAVVVAPDPAPTPEPPVAAAPVAPVAVPAEPVAVAIDPLRPDARIDPNDQSARADLWTRLRQGFAMPDLDTELVRKWEQWYVARPDYVQRMTERGGRYLFHILEETSKRGLPSELALLPFIESAYNPQAMSRAKASGMWQFIPGTGRDYALKQNVFRDDRRDVLASTRAALDYLQTLNTMFNDWQLALAAYNWGQGNVLRGIARNQKAGQPAGYLDLRMPVETREYLPKLQAVKNIVAHPEAFGLTLPALQNHPYFLSVPIQRDIDVALAARLADLPLEEFQQLNPQMNKPVILAAGTPQVLLPYDNANAFVRRLPEHKGAFASWTAWVAPKAIKPAEAAKQVGMSEKDLREVNRIPGGMLVKAGSTLLVPRNAHRTQDVDERTADNAMLALAPERVAARRTANKSAKGTKGGRATAKAVAAGKPVRVAAKASSGKHIHKPPVAAARVRLAQN